MVEVASGKIQDWEHHGRVTENNRIAISQISSREIPFLGWVVVVRVSQLKIWANDDLSFVLDST